MGRDVYIARPSHVKNTALKCPNEVPWIIILVAAATADDHSRNDS